MIERKEIESLIKQLYDYLDSHEGKGKVPELSKNFKVSESAILEAGERISEFYPGKEVGYSRKTKEIVLVNKGNIPEGYVSLYERMKTFIVALLSESQIGSKYFSSTLLATAYEVIDMSDANLVLFDGGIFAGKPYKYNAAEILLKTPEEQIELAKKVFPKSKLGLKTHAIAGAKDIWHGKNTINLIAELNKERKDVIYEGDEQKEFPIYSTNVSIILMHPVERIRIPKGVTYDLQKIMENITPKEGKIIILALGGYHRFATIPSYYEIELGLLLPSLIPQTPVLSRRNINPNTGIVILKLHLTKRDESTKVRNLRKIETIFIPLHKHYRKNDFLKTPSYEYLDTLERRIAEYLFNKGEASLGELSREFRISKDEVKRVIDSINKKEKRDRIVYYSKSLKFFYVYTEFENKVSIKEVDLGRNTIRLLAISDTHLLSKYQNLNLLKKLYEEETSDVDGILHCGDFTDGPPTRGYSGHIYDVVAIPTSTIIEWLIDVYPKPKSKDALTYAILGNHDLWFFRDSGVDILREVSRRRRDIVYSGNIDREFGIVKIKGILVALFHPEKSRPYTAGQDLQNFTKYAEDFVKRHIKDLESVKLCFLGNYHVAATLAVNDKMAIMVPSLKSPDSYFIPRGKSAFIGAWKVSVGVTNGDIKSFKLEYIDLSNKIDPEDYKQIYEWLIHNEKRMLSDIASKKGKRTLLEYYNK
jgi:predicted phosphodiesterase/DNA-binding MarR family transcriptional regulator